MWLVCLLRKAIFEIDGSDWIYAEDRNLKKIDIICARYKMLESGELNESTKALNISYSEAQFNANCACSFRKLDLL